LTRCNAAIATAAAIEEELAWLLPAQFYVLVNPLADLLGELEPEQASRSSSDARLPVRSDIRWARSR
jgi:hypothetical protein